MSSGNVIASLVGRDFVFNWRPSRSCGCKYEDLFEESKIRIIDINFKYLNKPWGVRNNSKFSILNIKDKFLFLETSYNLYEPSQDNLEYVKKEASRILRELPVKKELLEKISTYAESNLTLPSIGIHIRRGDFAARFDIESTCLSKFFEKVDEFLARYSNGIIFLATDDGAVLPVKKQKSKFQNIQNTFHEKYGTRVFSYPKKDLDRQKPEVIKDALVDLVLLTKTNVFLGTKGSTYSEVVIAMRDGDGDCL
jgi:hypothetical protein